MVSLNSFPEPVENLPHSLYWGQIHHNDGSGPLAWTAMMHRVYAIDIEDVSGDMVTRPAKKKRLPADLKPDNRHVGRGGDNPLLYRNLCQSAVD